MSGERCADCLFYEPVEVGKGVCQRNPPHPMAIPTGPPDLSGNVQFAMQGLRPPVAADQWCGEFEDKAEATEEPAAASSKVQ